MLLKRTMATMKYLGQREAQQLDEALMSATHGFSIDQLMELAGMSVACAIAKEYPITADSSDLRGERVLVVAGPGNNGGDALVAARHLQHFGFAPSIVYPKRSGKPLFQGLVTQCTQLEIPFLDTVGDVTDVDTSFDLILDGIFGFSFSGAIRSPFDTIVDVLRRCKTPIVSIDIPSGWHVERGNETGVGLEPRMLVSLSAPKRCAEHFKGQDRVHYVGGRFIPPTLAKAFELDLPQYPGVEQCFRVDNETEE